MKKIASDFIWSENIAIINNCSSIVISENRGGSLWLLSKQDDGDYKKTAIIDTGYTLFAGLSYQESTDSLYALANPDKYFYTNCLLLKITSVLTTHQRW